MPERFARRKSRVGLAVLALSRNESGNESPFVAIGLSLIGDHLSPFLPAMFYRTGNLLSGQMKSRHVRRFRVEFMVVVFGAA